MALSSDVLRSLLDQWVWLVAGAVALGLGRLVLAPRRPRPRTAPRAPAAVAEQWPVLGAASFWTERWSFFRRAIAASATGNFAFRAGAYDVVGLSGREARHVFYHAKDLGIAEGYAILGGNLPSAHVDGDEGDDIWPKQEFLTYMKERVKRMLRTDTLQRRLPTLVQDTRARLEGMQSVIDPFDDVYRLVFLIIMRTVGCDDVANDRALLDTMIEYYNNFTASATRSVIIFPRLPTPSLVKRYYYGARLFLRLQKIVKERQKLSGAGIKKFDDPLQELIDHHCGTSHMVGILLGAVFAGQQNTSVNAAWILVHLAHDAVWAKQVRDEIQRVAREHDPEGREPVLETLSRLPLAAWEDDFPTIRLCVKENLRLHGLGSQIRRNTGPEIPLGTSGEVIPPEAFVAFHTADMHLDSAVYPSPLTWDPARYLPDRAEDKRAPLAWAGWGAGRHVCLGMRLAQLQLHMLVALFFATFEDVQLCDARGRPTAELPAMDLETWVSEKPKGHAYLKLTRATTSGRK